MIISKQFSQNSEKILLNDCDKKITLFAKISNWIIEKDTCYANFEYMDKYPSKKSFHYLEKQALTCGWKPYNGKLDFLKMSSNWMRYLKQSEKEKTNVVFSLAKNYINKSKNRILLILVQYIDTPKNNEEALIICVPKNNKQEITLQIHSFNETEYSEFIKNEKQNKK
jgi:hypothetical protein